MDDGKLRLVVASAKVDALAASVDAAVATGNRVAIKVTTKQWEIAFEELTQLVTTEYKRVLNRS